MKILNFRELNSIFYIEIGRRFKFLRILMMLPYESVAKGAGLTGPTVKNIEEGVGVANFSTIIDLLNFYCISYLDFFNFSKALPKEHVLRKKMESEHKVNNLIAYDEISKKVDLIDLIEYRLLDTDLFEDWVIDKEVYDYVKLNFKKRYASIPNTLDIAVGKGWLELKPNFSPKSYRKKR